MTVRNVALLLLVSLALAGCRKERPENPYKAGDLLAFGRFDQVEDEFAARELIQVNSYGLNDRRGLEAPTYLVERVRGEWLLLQGGIVSRDSGFLRWNGLRGWIRFKSITPGNPWVLDGR